MGMRGKRDAGSREEAELPQGTEKEELRVTGFPCRSTGMTHYKKTGMTQGDESGRSMVEMLGVLAIMGVLAIGGIIGYRYAVDKYNANEIINEVKKRAIVASSQYTAGQSVSLSEFPIKINQNYPTSLITAYENRPSYFGIKVDNIKEGVCNQILNLNWQMPVDIHLNDIPISSEMHCQSGESGLTFIFDGLLGAGTEPPPGRCETTDDCINGCEECLDGLCQPTCDATASCIKDFDTGAKTCCAPDHIVDGVCCAYPGDNGTCCDENGEYCCPPDKPLYTLYGECVACDDVSSERQTAVKQDALNWQPCKRCLNRIYRNKGFSYEGWCVLKQCPSNTPVQSYNGLCYPCDYPNNINQGVTFAAKSYTETCHLCSSRFVYADKWCALTCPEGTIDTNGICGCPENAPIMDNTGRCHTCGEDSSFYLENSDSKTCAQICDGHSTDRPSRISFGGWNKRYCAKADCGVGKTYDNVYNCVSCQQTADFKVANTANKCEIDCIGVRYLDNTTCKKCPKPNQASNLTETQCQACGLTWNNDRCGG